MSYEMPKKRSLHGLTTWTALFDNDRVPTPAPNQRLMNQTRHARPIQSSPGRILHYLHHPHPQTGSAKDNTRVDRKQRSLERFEKKLDRVLQILNIRSNSHLLLNTRHEGREILSAAKRHAGKVAAIEGVE